jgi:hypothetical protein
MLIKRLCAAYLHFSFAMCSTNVFAGKNLTLFGVVEYWGSIGVIKELTRRISLKSSGLCFKLATKTSEKAECSLPTSIPVPSVGSFSWKMTKAVFSPCSRSSRISFYWIWVNSDLKPGNSEIKQLLNVPINGLIG